MKECIKYFVLLRAIATIAVISYHVGNGGGIGADLLVRDYYSGINVWCVPIFFMLSGALLLSRKRFVWHHHWQKTIRLIYILFFWSFIYNLLSLIFISKKITFAILGEAVAMIFCADIKFAYHLWFLYTIIGLYLVIPYLYYILQYVPHKQVVVLLILLIIFSWIIPTMNKCVFRFEKSIWLGSFRCFEGFTVYLLWGYLLHTQTFNRRMRFAFWGAGIIVFCLHAFLALQQCSRLYHIFCNYSSFTTAILATAVFLAAKYSKFEENTFVFRCIVTISKYSLPIYLLHVMIFQFMRKIFQFDSSAMPLQFSLPLLTIFVLIITTAVAWVFKKIPFINHLM